MSTTTEKWTIFGERLKTELERQEMSLRQFAEKAGLTLTTACRYVHSQRTPRATEILKAAKVLGVTCDYMLGLSDDPHKTRDGWAKAGFHELPSAQPETHEERTETHSCDLISRKAAIDAHYEYCNKHPDAGFPVWSLKILEDLPSAQPERETAKFIRWMEIKKTDEYISYTPHCKCSKCGTEFLINTIKYCYVCGAKMEENND